MLEVRQMEYLRSMKLEIELDTTKRTERATFSLEDYETTDAVLEAAGHWVNDQLHT